jgi:hypothetical protein
MTDVPTLTSATASNYPVWNPLQEGGFGTYADGNLLATCASITGTQNPVQTTIPSPNNTGIWYCEITGVSVGANTFGVGIIRANSKTLDEGYFYKPDGNKYDAGTTTTFGSSWTNGDVIGIEVNMVSGYAIAYKNGVQQGGLLAVFSQEIPYGIALAGGGGQSIQCAVNFGQRPFVYSSPLGGKRLNTFNLPDPTIGATETTQANKYFDATLYTGTGATKTVTNSGGMQPDLVWVKVRSTTGTHVLTDSVRGANNQLFSNLTNAQATATNKITGFTSTGFTLGADDGTGTGDANFNGSTYVGWQWKASGSTTSNTDGTITSTISANASSGFSVVTYTGNGTSGATVGHGLGATPYMIIVKRRNTTGNWPVRHYSLAGNVLFLNTTAASATGSAYWTSSFPTSSIFRLGSDSTVNANGSTYVAYCFAEINGYSKFSSYTGNGSANGTFVYTGFKPAFLMIKRTDSSSSANWLIGDSERNGYNGGPLSSSSAGNNLLQANTTNADTGFDIDYLSNGFKLRNTDSYFNASGGNFIYMAFAENPFKYSLAR